MNAAKIAAILLIVGGVLALGYGGFSYTDRHTAKVGDLTLSVDEKDWVSIPLWAGIGAIVAGALLMGFGRKT